MQLQGALIIVDVQRGFCNEQTAPTIPRIASLQPSFDPVIITRFVNPPGSHYERRTKSQSQRPKSAEVELAFEPVPRAVILDKETYGLGPHLERVLELTRGKRLTVCGWDTEVCVLAVAVQLMDAGRDVNVIAEYCQSCNGIEQHLIGLETLRRTLGPDNVTEPVSSWTEDTSSR